MEPFLHFKEDVFEDQSAFLVSFCSSGQPPARQIPEQVKICSEIKGLYADSGLHWFSQDLEFLSPHGHCSPRYHWYLCHWSVFPYLLVEDLTDYLCTLPHVSSCWKTVLLDSRKLLDCLHTTVLPLQQILEWLKPALPSPPPKTRPCNHKASFSSPSLVKAVYDRCLLKLLYNAVAWPDVLVHQWQVSFSFTCTVIERPFFLLVEVACFQPPPTQM